MEKYNLPDYLQARFRNNSKTPIIRDAYVVTEAQKQLGIGLFYHVITYGCQANVRDGEVISGILEELGYTHTELLESADIIILNTCAIRENAEKRVIGEIGFLQNYKRLKPSLIIGLCGCMAQEETVVNNILNKFPTVELIFGTHNIFELPQLVENILVEHQKSVQVYSTQGNIYEGLPSVRTSNYKASVNIMDGCDKFCTYCIVPYTRGKQRSRLLSDILNEVIELKNNGYKEIMLLGQNVNAYGKDLEDNGDFAHLLSEVAKTGIDRIRFMTSHPWDFTDGMIDAIKNNLNIMPYVHLPIQSGSSDVLKRMGRRYTIEDYLELFDKLKGCREDMAISTDIIVGFPDETDEDFQKTLDAVEHCKYDNAFSFIFSPRPNTPAAKMDDSIPKETKKKRLYALNERLDYYSKENNKKWEGQIVEVLIDGPSKNNPEIYSGYTPQNKLVNFSLKEGEIGDIIKVKIIEAKKNSLNGVQV